MTYTIIIPERVERILDKLEPRVNERIRTKLRSIETDPIRHCKRLVGTASWRLRVGSYRVILDIDTSKLIVLVIDIRPRSTAYR